MWAPPVAGRRVDRGDHRGRRRRAASCSSTRRSSCSTRCSSPPARTRSTRARSGSSSCSRTSSGSRRRSPSGRSSWRCRSCSGGTAAGVARAANARVPDGVMGPGGVPIARLFGIEIRISLTWAVLIAIVTLLGAQQASFTAPDLPAPVQWAIGGIIAFGFLVSVVAHELAHALVGRRYGIEQRSITLGFVGGLAPLDIQAPTPRDELAIALAGPLLSAGRRAWSSWPAGARRRDARCRAHGAVASSLIVLGALNLILAALSLLPGMPLDGGRVIRALAWARTKRPRPRRRDHRARRPAAGLHRHRRRDRDGARGPHDRGPARHRVRLAAHHRRTHAGPAAGARAPAARRHGPGGDARGPAVRRPEPHDRHVRRTATRAPRASRRSPSWTRTRSWGSSAAGGSSGSADGGSGRRGPRT